MTGALGFDPRAVLARIQGDAPRPDEAGFSRLASLAAPTPANSHAVASPGAGAEAPEPADATEALAAQLLRLAAAGAAALAAPDPDLDEERAVIAEARAAEAAGGVAVKPEVDHRRHLAGLERSALMRPPLWEGGAPPPGAWCSCCSRHKPEAGGRWWRPLRPRTDGLAAGPGWRCWACHPPPPGCETEEVRT